VAAFVHLVASDPSPSGARIAILGRMLPLVYSAIPIFLVLVFAEQLWLARVVPGRARETADHARLRGASAPDTRASLLLGLGNALISIAAGVVTLALYDRLHSHRLFEIGTGWPAFVLLFFAEDLTYYAWHRASHEVRFLWAAHENHHSSEYFNLSTALRQSWTTPFTVPLFYFWLPLAGFTPGMIATQISLSLIYQFWIHTELIDRMPAWFEALFNTPSHHRVHHGANVEYLDRNHAGILIVWDRLFGTFEPERERVVYGLTKNVATFSPPRLAFHEWLAMIREILRPAPLATRLAYVFAPPGWSPDGSTKTAAELREEANAQKRTGACAPVART
jgi:sterol desaturase/sphingolipid hydroxylase (fatty acid hydroxylase superfamily)